MANQHRGKNGKFRPDPETPEQLARVVELWGRGYTQEEIRKEIGWANCSTVSRAIDKAYAAVISPNVDAARKRSLERLDRAHRKAREIMDTDHILVSQGRVMLHPHTEQPLPDYGPNIQAIDRIVNIEKRLSALVGLDAPVKHSVDVVQRDALHAEMEQMMAELESNDAPPEDGVDADEADTAGVDS